jgi:hypothetical protein
MAFSGILARELRNAEKPPSGSAGFGNECSHWLSITKDFVFSPFIFTFRLCQGSHGLSYRLNLNGHGTL